MTNAVVNGINLHYQVDGPAGAPWLVLSNSLGTDLTMWAPQLSAFSARFRVLRYDTRGHGASAVPPGPYTIEQLTGDVLSLMDRLEIERASFCGISMGGLTGIALGARHPERLERLVLCNTAALIGSPATWNPRIEGVLSRGLPALAEGVLERWFTAGFRERAPQALATVREVLAATDAKGYAANCEAIRDTDLRGEVASIKIPTLVIAGRQDASTTAEQGRALADEIVGARYVEFDAAHITNIEMADDYTRTVLDFLTEAR